MFFINRWNGLQFEEGEIGIAVVGPVFTLLGHVFLKDGGGFGVVAIEAIEDHFDMFGAFRRIVKCYAHVV